MTDTEINNGVSRTCSNCECYINGANDEACDGCFEDKEHPNFKPKAQYCDDAVSRQAVLNTLDKMDKALDTDRTVENYKKLLTECYSNLPPVTPKEKTGYWIYKFHKGQFCSACDKQSIWKFDHCPNCGIKMIEPPESEEKK